LSQWNSPEFPLHHEFWRIPLVLMVVAGVVGNVIEQESKRGATGNSSTDKE
jgi:hypothetical protein